jgi:DGQHR domain-containing protein
MSKGKELVVRALRTHQGAGIEVFAFFIPGSLIYQIADISRIHRDDQDALHGFQRREIQNHVKNIIEYLDEGDVLFPNAIILALAPKVKFAQTRGRTPDGALDAGDAGTLFIPIREAGERVAWIVDGQQRSLALSRTKTKDLPVPVVAFVAEDLETQREQFILVNKAKPLPSGLINELLPEVDRRLPRDLAIKKIPSELCNLLNRDPESPFFELIARESTRRDRRAVIKDTALIDMILRSLNNPLGALSQFKGLGAEPTDVEGMYRALVSFWSAAKRAFPDAWGKAPSKSRLMHGAGIKAMGVLMDRIVPRAMASPNPDQQIAKSLEKIAPKCCWTEGTWPDLGMEWREIQNVPRHVKLLQDQLLRLDYEANQRP